MCGCIPIQILVNWKLTIDLPEPFDSIREPSAKNKWKYVNQVPFRNHRDPSATFGDCYRPSVPIDTCLEPSGPSQHTSGTISFIRGLSQTIWTHRDILRAICLLSATLRTHQLHSGTVRDHLYPSTHVWSYLVQVSILQDPSATFGVCRRPSGPIDTSSEISVCIQQPSRHISYIRGLSKTIWTHQDIFGAINLLSATIGTHQLHSGTVRDHLYPSKHVWSYLVQVGIVQDSSATFGVCRNHLDPSRHLQSYQPAVGNHRDTSLTDPKCS